MDYTARLRGIIRDFALTKGGTFVVLSEDTIFVKMLQSALIKQLAIPQFHVNFVKGIEALMGQLPICDVKGATPFVIIEQILHGRRHDQYVKKIKEQAPNCKIIVLANEITRDSLALLYELGADNTIVKPLSINTLVEKIANAIEPPARLGKLMDQARQLLTDGNAHAALSVTDSILAIKPDSATGLMLRGDALRDLGQHNEAILQYQQAMDTAQLFVAPVQRLAEHYATLGDTKRELHYLQKLDALSPLNYERKIDLGKASLVMGLQDSAHKYLDDAVRIAGQGDSRLLSDAASKLARACMEQYPEACERHLRTIVDMGGNAPVAAIADIWNRLGISLRRQGRWADAVAEYGKAIQRVPNDENLHFNKALAEADGQQYIAAADSLVNAIRINPAFGKQDAAVAARIGRIFQLAGDKDKAKEYTALSHELDIQRIQGPK
ncbi:tetratricopeptide repeat protein [Desulfovibrio mangrovi]|uniref:tetratricopeptide repeat protein n=1 Tax=Desulfovibrio mangrovi TaxID=2976983 RepID=UPI0022481002|nr:tetratricopeptide repeat protein [Desulfovibrio mangrovi]UZP65949.1 tetratricopeptide repeat protein [Desulfovibrio mangrovi]